MSYMNDETRYCFSLSYSATEARDLPTSAITPDGLEIKIDLGHIRGCLWNNEILVWLMLTTNGWKVMGRP
jgi:hypothetical protein